jgi:hypothetical protein
MTPLIVFLTKYLPPRATLPTVIVVYAVTLITVLLLMGRVEQPMLYLDVGRG